MKTVALLFFLAACSCPHVRHVDGHYAITAPVVTPSGIVEQGADPLVVDRLTDEVEVCLRNVPFECGVLPIDRDSFRVLVAADYIQLDDGEQVLPINAGEAGCVAKGLTGPEPCRWRAILQPDNLIVTTPNMRLYKDPLVRWVTGCEKIWTFAALARCAV